MTWKMNDRFGLVLVLFLLHPSLFVVNAEKKSQIRERHFRSQSESTSTKYGESSKNVKNVEEYDAPIEYKIEYMNPKENSSPSKKRGLISNIIDLDVPPPRIDIASSEIEEILVPELDIVLDQNDFLKEKVFDRGFIKYFDNEDDEDEDLMPNDLFIPADLHEDLISDVRPQNFSPKIENVIVPTKRISNDLFTTDVSISRVCKGYEISSKSLVFESRGRSTNNNLRGNPNNNNSHNNHVGTSTATVGVYYYPWYGDDFHGKKYMRKKLIPEQLPLLGEYDDKECEVIAQHFIWSRLAKVNLWVMSWWGKDGRSDNTIRESILTNPLLGNQKIAIHYETSGRTKFNSTSEPFTSLHKIGPDIDYLANTYFDHPNYYRINDRPVIVVYLCRGLAKRGLLQKTVEIMRSTAAQSGHQLYILGDYSFGKLNHRKISDIKYMDGVTNYDAYGSMKAQGYVGIDRLNDYFYQQSRWRAAAHDYSVNYVPVVTPGYNDRDVRSGNAPLSRKIDVHHEYGSLFEAMLHEALLTADDNADNLILVNSFNEWHEDTQIEPVVAAPPTFLNSGVLQSLSSPNAKVDDFAGGLEYEGYGTRYLQILHDTIN